MKQEILEDEEEVNLDNLGEVVINKVEPKEFPCENCSDSFDSETELKGQFTPGIRLVRYIWDMESDNYY